MKIPNQFKNNNPFKILVKDLPEEYQNLFIADGGSSNFGFPRTQWLDEDDKRPGRTPRGKAQNLLCIDSGSTDLFFGFDLVQKLREQTREPDYYGDIKYRLGNDGYIETSWFEFGCKESLLYWWGDLPQWRPNQGHNFVVGSDLSKGTGTSNSVSAVLDVNTDEICGLLVTPYLSISDFAELTVALCEWVGGNTPPLLIWEENGAPDFKKRIEELGYYNLYIKENLGGRKVKTGNKHGWRSTGGSNGTKISLLNLLNSALHEGLREEPRFTPLKIYDNQTINELESYVYFEGRIDVGPVAMQTESSGAKAAHGDRAIAVGLCNEGRKQQQRGSGEVPIFIRENSWAMRKQLREEKEAKEKADGKIWWL